MKRSIYISIAIFSFLLTSCSDFLEENPQTKLTNSNVYETKEGATLVLDGCYASLINYDYFGYRYFHVMSVTSGAFVSMRAPEVAFTQLLIQANELHIDKMYAAQYKTISIANEILYYLKDSKIMPVDKNIIRGDAYFLRAMTYFNLVRQFGKLSLITKPVLTYDEAQLPRSSVQDVYTQIISDLDSAYTLMPEKGANRTGRPNRWAAKALLAKVYVTMAGTTDNSPYWQLAYDAAKVVYDAKIYSLVRPFSAAIVNYSASSNNEIIFEVQGSSTYPLKTTDVTVPLNCSLTPVSAGGNQFGKTRPDKSTFDLFVNTYPGDPRIDASFIHTSYTNIKNKTAPLTVNVYPATKSTQGGNSDDITYPFIKKYVDPAFVINSNCNFIYLRFADVLLLLAEAANETDKTTEAIGYVNELLDRARDANGNFVFEPTELSPAAWPTNLSKTEVRDKILVERQIELCGEADEWYTFRRKGEAYLKSILERHNNHPHILNVATLPKNVYRFDTSDAFVHRNMLFPIPQTEINNNILLGQEDQNDGY